MKIGLLNMIQMKINGNYINLYVVIFLNFIKMNYSKIRNQLKQKITSKKEDYQV